MQEQREIGVIDSIYECTESSSIYCGSSAYPQFATDLVFVAVEMPLGNVDGGNQSPTTISSLVQIR